MRRIMAQTSVEHKTDAQAWIIAQVSAQADNAQCQHQTITHSWNMSNDALKKNITQTPIYCSLYLFLWAFCAQKYALIYAIIFGNQDRSGLLWKVNIILCKQSVLTYSYNLYEYYINIPTFLLAVPLNTFEIIVNIFCILPVTAPAN